LHGVPLLLGRLYFLNESSRGTIWTLLLSRRQSLRGDGKFNKWAKRDDFSGAGMPISGAENLLIFEWSIVAAYTFETRGNPMLEPWWTTYYLRAFSATVSQIISDVLGTEAVRADARTVDIAELKRNDD
jgi:hypothetical protein